MGNHYRHELKYQISYPEYLVLRQKLRLVMRPDAHTDERGCYHITSLYFDNRDDKALREKVDGINRREKFRLRYYGTDTQGIKLEKKQKMNGLCLKTSEIITPEACAALLFGAQSWMDSGDHPLQQELDFKMKTEGLRPRTIVIYDREPYIYETGNVRVTFDMNIRTGQNRTDFLNPGLTLPVNTDGRIILEVKYDAFLPGHIRDILQTGTARAGVFSKYAACRSYE